MFLLFCAVVALAKATPEYESPYYVNTGNSQQYRTQDDAGNYRFGYDESHASGGTFRDETGDAWGNKWGSYGLREADGRYRVVNYVADSQGFRAEVKSNEQGLTAQEPVTSVTSTTKTSVKKPVLYAAPVAQSAPVSPVSSVPVHHSYNPEYPLLYHHNPYHSYYVPYGNYKGTPFRSYGPYYKGTPYTRRGSPIVTKHGYYIYP